MHACMDDPGWRLPDLCPMLLMLALSIHHIDESVWDLEMEDSADCVLAIQQQLSTKGIEGKKTSQAALNTMDRAKNLIREVRRGDG